MHSFLSFFRIHWYDTTANPRWMASVLSFFPLVFFAFPSCQPLKFALSSDISFSCRFFLNCLFRSCSVVFPCVVLCCCFLRIFVYSSCLHKMCLLYAPVLFSSPFLSSCLFISSFQVRFQLSSLIYPCRLNISLVFPLPLFSPALCHYPLLSVISWSCPLWTVRHSFLLSSVFPDSLSVFTCA